MTRHTTAAARSLAEALNKRNREHDHVTGMIVDTKDAYDRKVVVVNLDGDLDQEEGRLVNAMAWGQADLRVGQMVVVGRIRGKGKTNGWRVVSVDGESRGEKWSSRQPDPVRILYKGEPERPKSIPRDVGGRRILRRMQDQFRLMWFDFETMKVQLQMPDPMNPDRIERCQYWLYAWRDDGDDTHKDEFQTDPIWSVPITTTANVVNSIGKRYSLAVDLTHPDQDVLMEPPEDDPDWDGRLLFAIVLKRTASGPFSMRDAGRISRAVIRLS